jgi:hypothetical protein
MMKTKHSMLVGISVPSATPVTPSGRTKAKRKAEIHQPGADGKIASRRCLAMPCSTEPAATGSY